MKGLIIFGLVASLVVGGFLLLANDRALTNVPASPESEIVSLEDGFDETKEAGNVPTGPSDGGSESDIAGTLQNNQLVGREWVWVRTELGSGETTAPPAGERYVLTLDSEGGLSSTTDCNGLGGQYVLDGEVLSMGGFISTMMYCEGSQESVYSGQLALVNSFVIEGDTLRFNLNRDYGTMYFQAR